MELRPLRDVSKAKVAQDPEDHLVARRGTGKVQLSGADFEFVDKVEIAKAGDKKAPAKEITFTLPQGQAQGDQESMEVEKVAFTWPPPSPDAPIYVWLRGENSGRLTDAKY